MLYDIDGDGTNDVGVVDKNGNLFWIRIGEFGQYLEDYHIQVPKLKIKRDWADGLDPKFTDNYVITSMFDHKSDRDNGRQYGYAPPNEGSLFSKKNSGSEKTATVAKVKVDDLGSLQVGQITYPELGKHEGESKAEQTNDGALHGRRLLGDEAEEGAALDVLSLADSQIEDTTPTEEKNQLEIKNEKEKILDSPLLTDSAANIVIDESNVPDEKISQNLAQTEKEEVISSEKDETKNDAKMNKDSVADLETKVDSPDTIPQVPGILEPDTQENQEETRQDMDDYVSR